MKTKELIFSTKANLRATWPESTFKLTFPDFGDTAFTIPFSNVAEALAADAMALDAFVDALGTAVDAKSYAGLSYSGLALVRAISELGKQARAK